jgi:ATP-dependent DNA helicase PIF1
LVGDFFQLRPVKGKYLFRNDLLWSLFKPFILQQNMRQASNCTYANMLNRIRIGAVSDDDIFALRSRLVSLYEVLSNDILHIYPTKKEVNEHNERMQNLIPSDLHTFTASHVFSSNDIGVNEEVSNEYIPDDNRDAGGLPYCKHLSVGTRVMLIRNSNVEYGLVNGAIGEVTNIHENDTVNNCSYITVKFPDINLPSCLSDVPHHVNIEKFDQEYLYKGRFILRQNFPLITFWATTIHKVQGLSLKKAAVAIGNSIFQHGQAYVALSRVEQFQNLYVLTFF